MTIAEKSEDKSINKVVLADEDFRNFAFKAVNPL